ncbi:hypothetical protein [Herbaspirillum seropedicae]|uniref:hypothetical protein n=1 Tax=Herbaspirillum seropedicae TaxID=964 RepID=UPI002858625C|nr:hypothetical protein [Herbaspirillum seropedicae]MDR6395906.1 hypothetical protein [Herbaspirillum seropedicae]
MYAIQMQAGPRGLGMGYEQFIEQFVSICQEHLEAGCAKAFAFVFYDMAHGVVRQALHDASGFRLLHERTGKDFTLFYLHSSAIDAYCQDFNERFMSALGIGDQASPPCMVFFHVHNGSIQDVSIYDIDDQTEDPVLVAAELEQYVGQAKKLMYEQGNLAPLFDVRKLIPGFVSCAEFITKLKGWN